MMVSSEPSAVEEQIVDFAEDIGRMLGTVQAKAESWLDQRKSVVGHLRTILNNAAKMLEQLGEVPFPRDPGKSAGSSTAKAKGRGRPPKSAGIKRGRPKGFKMSPEARKKMAEAAKRRWADKKKQA